MALICEKYVYYHCAWLYRHRRQPDFALKSSLDFIRIGALLSGIISCCLHERANEMTAQNASAWRGNRNDDADFGELIWEAATAEEIN